MFHHRNILKYTWTSPDGKTHKQIDHVLIERRWQSSVLDVRSFRGADCDTDHYPVIAEVRKRFAVGKQPAQRYDRQRFNLRKLNQPEVREQYQTEITNRLAVSENLNDDEDVNRTWENIKENIQTSAKDSLGLHELKQNKPWFIHYKITIASNYHEMSVIGILTNVVIKFIYHSLRRVNYTHGC